MNQNKTQEIRDYLNYITRLKMTIGNHSVVKDDSLNHVINEKGERVFSCSDDILKIFNEC